MKYVIKVFLVFIILAGSLFGVNQSNIYANENDTHWKKIKESGVLRVGLSADYAPLEFEKNINGKTEYAGVDIELAKKIAKDNHLKLKIINMQFDSLLGALKTGKIDIIISGMTTTPEREKEVSFTKPYMMTNNIMLVKKKEKSHLSNISDFKQKRIAVQKGTDQEKIAKTEIENADVMSLNKLPETILSVKSNKADGAILEKPVAEAYIKQNPELAFSDVTFNEEKKPTCIALPKNSPILLKKLNQSIDEVNDKHLIDQYMTQASKDMDDDGNFYTKYKSFFIKGIKNTVLISVVGVVLGAVLGAFIALMKISKIKPLSWIASIYIEFLRGTPLLVQVFIVFFGTTAALGLDISALICGIIALVINASAYIAEIFRAGINSIDKGQTEAARSLGLSYNQTMKTVILPQAIKNILPALGNEFVTLIKESSIVSTIGVGEIMFNAQVVQGISFDPFTPLLIAAGMYFILTFTLSRVMNFIEGRMKASD